MDQWQRDKTFLRIFLSLVFVTLYSFTFSQNPKIDSLIQQYNLCREDKSKLDAAIKVGREAYSLDTTLYLKYANIALQLSQKVADKKREGKINLALGYYYSERNLYKALDYATTCLSIFKELDSLNYLSQAYTLLGTIYYYNGSYSKSFEYYFESLKINEQLKNEKDLPVDYNNLAIIYSAQKNNKKALEYFFKALRINQKYGSTGSYSGNLVNISMTYGDLDSIQQEVRYGEMALDTVRKYGDKETLSHILLSLGYTYVKLKEFEKAEKYYAEAESMFLEQGSRYYLYYLYSSKGQLYKEKKEIDKAITFYKLTLQNAQKDGVSALIQDASLELSKIYKDQKNYKEGLEYYEIYHNISDSIFNVEKSKTISELELQYTFDKVKEVNTKEKLHQQKIVRLQRVIIFFSILALVFAGGLIVFVVKNYRSKHFSYMLLSERNVQIQKQSDELRQQRDQLKQLNQTKDKMNSIIAHDLKNPFNSILGFGKLVIENWDELDDNRRKKYIGKINESANSAYDLLNNLLEWSRSQTGSIKVRPECIELYPNVDQSIASVSENARLKKVTIKNTIDQSVLVKADANMLGSIIRNLLSNAIKFSNRNGEITVSSRSVNKEFVAIEVKDNGIGMSQDVVGSLFNVKTQVSSYGTENEKGTGLGLLICKDFVERNGGHIEVESEVGAGSKFIFTLPSC